MNGIGHKTRPYKTDAANKDVEELQKDEQLGQNTFEMGYKKALITSTFESCNVCWTVCRRLAICLKTEHMRPVPDYETSVHK